MSVFRKQSRADHVYISGSSEGGNDFIPAFRGSGRLQSGEVDSKVFGNPMFDDEPTDKLARGSNPFAKNVDMRRQGSVATSSPLKQAFVDADEPAPAPVKSIIRPSSIPKEVSVDAWERELREMVKSHLRLEAIRRPAPSDGMVQCYVKRVKNFFGTHCSFQVHLESNHEFLLAARRRKKSKVSSYVISQDLEDLKRDTDNCLAKLKANFSGTEYMLWGKSADPTVRKGYAKEKLCINFKQNSSKGGALEGGPRSMITCMPIPETKWEPDTDKGTGLEECLVQAVRHELPPQLDRKLCMLATKPAEYDESLKGYTLDFKGRVKEASVKNFQLVHWDHTRDQKGAQVALQFGKVEEDQYVLDFSYPLNVELAFAIALASIDTKLCYTY